MQRMTVDIVTVPDTNLRLHFGLFASWPKPRPGMGGPEDQLRIADEISGGHATQLAAVQRPVAVVAQHEVGAQGHGQGRHLSVLHVRILGEHN